MQWEEKPLCLMPHVWLLLFGLNVSQSTGVLSHIAWRPFCVHLIEQCLVECCWIVMLIWLLKQRTVSMQDVGIEDQMLWKGWHQTNPRDFRTRVNMKWMVDMLLPSQSVFVTPVWNLMASFRIPTISIFEVMTLSACNIKFQCNRRNKRAAIILGSLLLWSIVARWM